MENNSIKESTIPCELPQQEIKNNEVIDSITKQTIYEKGKSTLKGDLDDDFLENFSSTNESILEYEDLIEEAISENERDIIYHKGDLKLNSINSLFKIGIDVLIVEGDLIVEDNIVISDNPMQLLFVTGNVTANNLITSGTIFIEKNLTIKQCLIGDYNEGYATIGNNVTTRFFDAGDYTFEIEGVINHESNSSRTNLTPYLNSLHLDIVNNLDLENLDPECKDGDIWQYIDRYQFLDYVKANKTVYKN